LDQEAIRVSRFRTQGSDRGVDTQGAIVRVHIQTQINMRTERHKKYW
jgi:hypothetical protein